MLADGWHPRLPVEAYHAAPRLSYSILGRVRRSPAHARHAQLHPDPPTEAMMLGTALHAAALEPERFAAEWAAGPAGDRRTKAVKLAWAEAEAEHPGATFLRAADYSSVRSAAAAVLGHPEAGRLVAAAGFVEASAFWTDEETGLHLRCRPDKLLPGLAIDLKKCQDARPHAVARSIETYGYHIQAAGYIEGLRAVSPADRGWCWIFVEAEPPHGIGVYRPTEQLLSQGRALWRAALRQWAECERTGVWPAYPTDIEWIDLPKWAQEAA